MDELNEHLDNYFDALPAEAREWMVAEEKVCREELKISILSDEAYAKLQKRVNEPESLADLDADVTAVKIEGCFSYDILANFAYAESF